MVELINQEKQRNIKTNNNVKCQNELDVIWWDKMKRNKKIHEKKKKKKLILFSFSPEILFPAFLHSTHELN